MRKHQQRQILELLQTIREGQSAGFYADCQDGALSIGEFIESIKGKGTQTVALLDDYCELLFKASNGEIGEKPLKRQLIKIENSVRFELKPTQIEIAFLSYKASMSDSIKSVYLSAKADPMCDAYWIPIPYYTHNADGSLEAMLYEGADCYGNNIVCEDWREYDIEARHPDVIFTFNPYDADNYITSVHPDFYCKRLRDLTDCLIYIPYFVAIDDVPEHFCTTEGCVHAHKVIVQSEKIRETYIRVFKEEYGDSFGKPKDKFIALGSPKFDKAINSNREDYDIPDEWRALIGDRKVIFYNTVVSAILKDDEQYLIKLRQVLGEFKERDDVVLWWRPHPLNEATYRLMRPMLLGEYERIVSDYKREGWGVYDTTPNLHRAIAWSDAYYGDWSSLVAMYQAAEKPIAIQDADTGSAFSELGFRFPLALSVLGNSLYYFMYQRNALLALDLDTYTARYVCSVPNESIFGRDVLYNYSEVIDGKLYLPPFFGNDLVIYDCVTNSCQIAGLELQEQYIVENTGKFYGILQHNGLLFLLPYKYPAIIAHDIKTGKTVHCLDLKIVFPELQGTAVYGYFHKYEWLDSSRILLPVGQSNTVLEFNLDDYTYVIHKIGKVALKLGYIAKHNEDYWIVPLNKPKLFKWNYSANITEEFSVFPISSDKNFLSSEVYFSRNQIVKYKSYLYLFPDQANMVCRLDMENGTIEHLDEFDKYCKRDADEAEIAFFNDVCKHDDKIYTWTKENVLLEYDIESKKIREFSNLFDLSDADNQRLTQDYFYSLLNGTELSSKMELSKAVNFGHAGKSIFDYTKKLILD